MEQAAPPVRQISIAEHLEQFPFDVTLEVFVRHTHMQVDFQRHEFRFIDLQVMTGHAIPLDVFPNIGFERIRQRGARATVHSEERCVPTPCPAERRRGTLYIGMTFGHLRVIRLGDGTLLHAIGHRRALPNVLQRFRLLPADGRQRVPNLQDLRHVQRNVHQ